MIAQTLSYAAALHGITRVDFEEILLNKYLSGQSLFDRVRETAQGTELAQSEFEDSLESHLSTGSFRAVIVLDEAPPELVNLVGFLEAVTTGMSFDLIAVKSYLIGEHRIAVPQRLDPERRAEFSSTGSSRPQRRASAGHLEAGVRPFRELIEQAETSRLDELKLMTNWAEAFTATHPAVTAATYFGEAGDVSLLPRFKDENVGLVTLWCYKGGRPAISFWRSVFERRAPHLIAPIESLTEKRIGQGSTVNQVTQELLKLIEEAYLAGLEVDPV